MKPHLLQSTILIYSLTHMKLYQCLCVPVLVCTRVQHGSPTQRLSSSTSPLNMFVPCLDIPRTRLRRSLDLGSEENKIRTTEALCTILPSCSMNPFATLPSTGRASSISISSSSSDCVLRYQDCPGGSFLLLFFRINAASYDYTARTCHRESLSRPSIVV